MVKLPILTPKRLTKILEAKGFKKDHVTGSHFIFRHPISKKRVTVPFGRRDLPRGTMMNILREANISKEDLIKQ